MTQDTNVAINIVDAVRLAGVLLYQIETSKNQAEIAEFAQVRNAHVLRMYDCNVLLEKVQAAIFKEVKDEKTSTTLLIG